jgi:hypothetical protein
MAPEAFEIMEFAPENDACSRRTAPAPKVAEKGAQASEKIDSQTESRAARPRYPVTSSASRPVSVRPYSSTASTTTR